MIRIAQELSHPVMDITTPDFPLAFQLTVIFLVHIVAQLIIHNISRIIGIIGNNTNFYEKH